jgi:hypothetical protein
VSLKGLRRDVRKLRELAELGAMLGDRSRDTIELREIAPGVFAKPTPTAFQRRALRKVDELGELAQELNALGDACRKL